MKNTVLDEIEQTGRVRLPDGSELRVHSHVGEGGGALIRRAIALVRPQVSCEVGLAFGMSTLYILDAMREHGNGRLIGMDPVQDNAMWRNAGLHNVARAGFAGRYEFHKESSQSVLPRLASAGTRIQFGFVDGWHTFDHALVDFFYLDLMLDVTGVLILDDVAYPSIRRLAQFILANRAYELLEFDPVPRRGRSVRQKVKSALRSALLPLVRDDFTPDATVRRRQAAIDSAQLIALRKVGEDKRSYDHFVPF